MSDDFWHRWEHRILWLCELCLLSETKQNGPSPRLESDETDITIESSIHYVNCIVIRDKRIGLVSKTCYCRLGSQSSCSKPTQNWPFFFTFAIQICKQPALEWPQNRRPMWQTPLWPVHLCLNLMKLTLRSNLASIMWTALLSETKKKSSVHRCIWRQTNNKTNN